MNRAERRRRERTHRKDRQPVVIAGDGIVAAELGQRFEARPHATLPDKVPGRHRWIATAAYVLTDSAVEAAGNPDVLKFLDHENLMSLAIGCWDCEQPLGVIERDSRCPAEAS